MRFQTYCRLFLLSFLFLFAAAIVAAQQSDNDGAQPENFYRDGTTRSAVFDRFPAVSECELRGRLDNFLVALRDNPGAKGYIIFYRGADEKPARQADGFAANILSMYSNHVRMRRLPQERVITIDGGFRPSMWTELWFVPPGGEMPEPSGTVAKPALPKNIALMLESSFMELEVARIPEPDEEKNVENQETTTEVVSDRQNPAESQTEPEEEFFEWTSDYFARFMREDKSVKGHVIFYLDESEYDLAKARAIIERGMKDLAAKTKVNLSGVKTVFGGYRENPEVEFWVVPRGAKKPTPTPAKKEITQ